MVVLIDGTNNPILPRQPYMLVSLVDVGTEALATAPGEPALRIDYSHARPDAVAGTWRAAGLLVRLRERRESEKEH
jgi:hypothetical protein